MIATVVGPQGEEIYCDNFGRVKVHFPWDRYSSSNEKSSCWVRVAQEWAGSQYGSMAIPRVGHEVIVSFLNGDPDQPIITGRTYHATNTAPYALPDHKTKTVLRTETHQGQGYNELSFEDQAGSEQILLHAQKDWDALIEHDHTEVIRHDQHLTVDNDRFTRIQRNQHLTVEGEVRSKIALDSSHEVGASLQHKVGQRIAVEAGKEISLKSGAKIVVEAGAELTLKAGGSFVKVDAGGVHLVGPAINLNAGGSAGSGSAYGGQLAAAPRMLAQAKPVAELVQPDIAASMQSGAARVIDVASLPTMMPSSANNTANGEPVAEEKTPERILKSDLLKPSDELEKLAKRQAGAYRQGNHSDEVKLLQEALIKLGFDLGKAGADGDFGSKTKTAIEQFQKSYQPSHQTHPSYSIGPVDGIVGNGTLLALDEALMDGWVYESPRFPMTLVNGELAPIEFLNFYNGDEIGESDYEEAARELNCEVAAIKAVAKTETGSYGAYFNFGQGDDDVPAILFERHHFHKYTNGKYDMYEDISNPIAGGYGTISTQYSKLMKAYALDKRAALKSVSWGKFQILASNYVEAGYSSPEDFILDISKSEKNQLKSFVNFIKFDKVLLSSIRSKNWLSFARRYNGPRQKGYDLKMEKNYNDLL